MAHSRTRLSLVEYGAPVDLCSAIIAATGVDRTKATSLLIEAGSRAASSLKLNYNPISVGTKGARAIDFAGLIRIAPSLELEVAPKFLGLDDDDAAWREDFFFLATLSRHGRLLASERLSASGGASRDLSTLVARAMTSMYENRKRRPLRTYRRDREVDFYLDGDVDPVDLIFPSMNGFEQEVMRFDRNNAWNADIVAAAKLLLPEVSDPSVMGSLIRLVEDLSPQRAPAARRKAIPARHASWKVLHRLSVDVLRGLGINYKQGQVHAPGYLVETWRVWEDLITVAARLDFGHSAVIPQTGFPLGVRAKAGTGKVTGLSVYPDCVIESDGTRPRILVDAKYKGHVESGQLRVTEADIYESLAFCKATGCDLVVLAYPAQPRGGAAEVGTGTIFERIQVDSIKIIGIQIELRGISKTGALRLFSSNFGKALKSLANETYHVV